MSLAKFFRSTLGGSGHPVRFIVKGPVIGAGQGRHHYLRVVTEMDAGLDPWLRGAWTCRQCFDPERQRARSKVESLNSGVFWGV